MVIVTIAERKTIFHMKNHLSLDPSLFLHVMRCPPPGHVDRPRPVRELGAGREADGEEGAGEGEGGVVADEREVVLKEK